MATYVLIPGAGADSWYWHLVVPKLEARGHRVVAVDLPWADAAAGLDDYTDAVVTAIGDDRDDLVLVAQSMGGFTAPLVCDRLPVELIVLVAAMVPAPGESAGGWWGATGQEEAFAAQPPWDGQPPTMANIEALFLHDVPPDVAAESADHVTEVSDTPFGQPWPAEAWPDVPTRFLLCRDDRFFPAAFMRRLARVRLGLVADEMDGGHLPALARPDELAARLDAYWPPR